MNNLYQRGGIICIILDLNTSMSIKGFRIIIVELITKIKKKETCYVLF
jgi:hypothetical protein